MEDILGAGAAAGAAESAKIETPTRGDAIPDALNDYLNKLPPLEEEREQTDPDDEEFEDETEEEREEREERLAAADAKKDADAKPKEEPKAADADAAAKPEPVSEEMKANAAFGETWFHQITTDPVNSLSRLVDQLGPDVKAGLLEQLGAKADATDADPGFDLNGYEPYSDGEAALLKHLPDIKGIKALPDTLRKEFGQGIHNAIKEIVPFLDTAHVKGEMTDAKVDAILEFLGMDLGNLEAKDIFAKIADGKTSYRDAVREKIGNTYKEKVMLLKQAQKERATTPGGSGDGFSMPAAGSDGIVSLASLTKAMRGK